MITGTIKKDKVFNIIVYDDKGNYKILSTAHNYHEAVKKLESYFDLKIIHKIELESITIL